MSGAPLSVIAHNLGHAGIKMLEQHYGHMAPSYVAETIRKFAPDFGTTGKANLVSIEHAKRG
jgi:hypothetical protein